MIHFLIASLAGGILFGIMDGLIHANPLAVKLYEVFKPISRPSVNFVAGMIIDLAYGFAMAGIFLVLYKGLPGHSGILKGLSFAVLAWFLRVLMTAVSEWMMFNVGTGAVLHMIAAGFVEMVVLGVLFGLVLKPVS